ncbi:MAG: RdgB/HAM1 family non-canonical purine NTP pyrophosphatase [Alphaproteobacteria bacterium]|nr:RdgB/HAM1 family non-canonical purine NTP pyrophosphatase [Alphaproteobacteria bacterium]
MRRILPGERLLIATHNSGKAREIGALLSPYIGSFTTSAELGLAEPEETGDTFVANALIKARQAARESGLVALADDSGLSVTSLGGEPGIYSARWGGPKKDFVLAMQKVHEALGDQTDRSACFICVLALAWPDGEAYTFEGRIDGQIVWPARGDKGFGYDPIFVANGHSRTFAEIEPAEKQTISHRARAFEKLMNALAAA